jgi:hypothetical protein
MSEKKYKLYKHDPKNREIPLEMTEMTGYRLKTLISVDELAERIGLSVESIETMTECGYIPYFKFVTGEIRYRIKDVIERSVESVVRAFPAQTRPEILPVVMEDFKLHLDDVPEELKLAVDELKQFFDFKYPSCVYFLVEDKEIKYVGKSCKLATRVDSHRAAHGFRFKVFYVPIPKFKLSTIETEFISLLDPEWNKTHVDSDRRAGSVKEAQQGFVKIMRMAYGEYEPDEEDKDVGEEVRAFWEKMGIANSRQARDIAFAAKDANKERMEKDNV